MLGLDTEIACRQFWPLAVARLTWLVVKCSSANGLVQAQDNLTGLLRERGQPHSTSDYAEICLQDGSYPVLPLSRGQL
jgi:hypothetical protein